MPGVVSPEMRRGLGLEPGPVSATATATATPASLRAAFDQVKSTGGGNAVTRLLSSNVEAWSERWEMMKSAKKSIDSTYFILERDIFGFAFLGMCLKKLGEGVSVRMMIDAMSDPLGTKGFKAPWGGKDYLQELVHSGAEVGIYHPVHMRAAKLASLELMASNHDKILVVDGERSMTGGRNIAADYFLDPNDMAHAWRDTDVVMDGGGPARALIGAFEREFERKSVVQRVKPDLQNLASRELELKGAYLLMDTWLSGKPLDAAEKEAMRENPSLRRVWAEELVDEIIKKLPSEGFTRAPTKRERKQLLGWAEELAAAPELRGQSLRAPSVEEHVGEVKILDQTSVAGGRVNDIAGALESFTRTAQKRIVIENPYVVLTEPMLQALEDAAKRGVEVWIGTNSPLSTDSAATQAFFLDEWAYVLARIPKARIFVATGERKLHAKVATIDDVLSVVSTYNLDFLSGFVNSEVAAAIWSPGFAADVNASFAADRDDPKNGVLEYKIARDEEGRAILKDGKPIVLFGPEDHLPQEILDEYAPRIRNWRMIRRLPYFDGLDHPTLEET